MWNWEIYIEGQGGVGKGGKLRDGCQESKTVEQVIYY